MIVAVNQGGDENIHPHKLFPHLVNISLVLLGFPWSLLAPLYDLPNGVDSEHAKDKSIFHPLYYQCSKFVNTPMELVETNFVCIDLGECFWWPVLFILAVLTTPIKLSQKRFITQGKVK